MNRQRKNKFGLSLQQLRLAQTFVPVVKGSGRKLPQPLPSVSIEIDSQDLAFQLHDLLLGLESALEIKLSAENEQLCLENVVPFITSELIHMSSLKKTLQISPVNTRPLRLPVLYSCPYVLGLASLFIQSTA